MLKALLKNFLLRLFLMTMLVRQRKLAELLVYFSMGTNVFTNTLGGPTFLKFYFCQTVLLHEYVSIVRYNFTTEKFSFFFLI